MQKNCNWTKHKFPETSNIKLIDSLNQRISIEEIKKIVKSLKTQKAQGLDNTANEMMKCLDKTNNLQTLFINIMESGYFPDFWNQVLVCLIYKSGIKDDPNKYRSTALSNCLEKLFNTIFFNNLLSKPQKKYIYIYISPAHTEFHKNRKTSDDIFRITFLSYVSNLYFITISRKLMIRYGKIQKIVLIS